MSGSTTGIIVIVVVVVLGLALWLTLMARAARHTQQEHPHDPMRGLVQGGQPPGSIGPDKIEHQWRAG